MTKGYIFECFSKYKNQHIANILRSILRKYIYKLQMHLFFIHLFKMYYTFENALNFPYDLAYGLGKINKFKRLDPSQRKCIYLFYLFARG